MKTPIGDNMEDLRRIFAITVVIVCSVPTGSGVTSGKAEITAVFPKDTGDPITWNKLAVDPASKTIYAGAVNQLFQLDEDLSVVAKERTGPVLDNPKCYNNFGSNPCLDAAAGNLSASGTDNHNRILAVDSRHHQLVTCGSVFQGTCQTRSLSNISNSTSYSWQFSQYVIVASRTSPTVAFVGPGPFEDDVLYVGTSYDGTSNTDWLLTKLLAGVSSRNLTQPGPFLVTEVDDTQAYGTRASLTQDAASKYRVNYVTGFGLDGFSYFLTTQPDQFSFTVPSGVLASKLIQVCQQDRYFDSYVEMRVTCLGPDGTDYNLVQAATVIRPGARLAGALNATAGAHVLVGVFSTSNQTGFGSALCVYPFGAIRKKFTENIQKCYDSPSLSVGPQFYGQNRPCSAYSTSVSESYCGSLFTTLSRSMLRNSPLVGSVSLVGSAAALVLPGVNVTAVSAVTVDDDQQHTVLFLGTSTGRLVKALLDSVSARVYEDSGVGSSAVNQDLLISPEKSHLYLMTAERIYKIPVSSCHRYRSCDQCLAAKDPYCGWCSLDSSCRRRSACPNNRLGDRWLSPYSQTIPACPRVSVTPLNADVNSDVDVIFEVESMPELKRTEYFICTFEALNLSTTATVIGNTINCPVRRQRSAALITADDSIDMVLSVRMSDSSKYFIQTNFTFYDCGRHTACSPCSDARWNCHWCIFANRCQKSTSSCPSDPSVPGRQFCPTLMIGSREILIPVGIEKSIALAANNLPVPQANEGGYFCEISTPDQQVRLIPAVRVNSSVISCMSYAFPSGPNSSYAASLRVVWGDNFLIEGTYNITVFDCAAMSGGDCSRCLSLQYEPNSKFGCQWCEGSCQSNVSDCRSLSDETIRCPRAVITSVIPHSGPKEGGTRVTINGTNLGYRFGKVVVSIGNARCKGVPAQYVISRQYVCITESVLSAGQQSLTVVVSNESAHLESKLSSFTFTNPEVFSIHPQKGPQAGGTPVTISGRNLNTGSSVSIFLDQQPCIIDRSVSTENQIVCLTTNCSSSSLRTRTVTISFDEAVRSLNMPFQYVENPKFTKLLPDGSFQAGGCTVTVPTSKLDSIVGISLSLSNGEIRIPINITFRNDSVIQFRSPRIVQDGLDYRLQMILDGVRSSLPFIVYRNPKVEEFSDGVQPYGDTIQITGRNMLVPCMNSVQSEVLVYVGSQLCNISSLTDTNLYCRPPNKTPDGSSRVPVRVMFGENLSFYVGELDYQVEQGSIFWPIVVGVIGGVLVVIIIVLIFIFCLMSSKNERQYGKLQAQMEALESGVRNECKQAFTELQTDVSDFTSDISVIGIPFWEYRMYAFKLLFPMVISHQVLYINSSNGRRLGEFSNKMVRFNQLLSSKFFLLTFIHTMEKQPQDFGIADRSKVASLLSVVLMDKMEYATEIIKILLDELIVRSLEKRTQKIMLRRSETVVEKLLANWLSLSMYGYLKANAGRALFMLYKAIKHQTEKGPIDAVTGEAKYSLSEDRLLREKIEAKTLVVKINEAENFGQSPVMCKVLDCDTITQAKEKALDAIYKNTPFSKRPARSSTDLRLNAGMHLDGYPGDLRNFLPLSDQDVTTDNVNGWKKLNTLSHYHIKEGSVFQLHTNNKKELVSSIPDVIETETVWHLAKHEDVSNNVNRTQKVISEIFLTRLLQTKMTLQQYIDDLFATILRVDSSLPPTVKYLYDYLDSAAQQHGITDLEVVHAWKSNSLPLRFWVNLIKNPEFLFDINKSPVVDCCLSVIAQTFMDGCSTHEHRLGKDSPSAKLLFAKDIPRYRHLVTQFYSNVRELPAITNEAMAIMMTDLSATYSAEFNQEVALCELYDYALRFSSELHLALENDPSAKKLRLAEHFEQLHLIKDESINNSMA